MEQLMAAAYKYNQLAQNAPTPALAFEYERLFNWLTELMVYKQEEINRKALEVQKLRAESQVSVFDATRPDDNFIKHQLATAIAGQLMENDLLVVSSTTDAVTQSIRYEATAFVAKPKADIVKRGVR